VIFLLRLNNDINNVIENNCISNNKDLVIKIDNIYTSNDKSNKHVIDVHIKIHANKHLYIYANIHIRIFLHISMYTHTINTHTYVYVYISHIYICLYVYVQQHYRH
jgi:hypothetical protein